MAERPTDPDPTDTRARYPGTPGWVKALGIIAVVVVLLIGFILVTGLGGPHGPERHGARAPTSAVAQP
jgi:hypothetical protein